jgi:hypothetical protein
MSVVTFCSASGSSGVSTMALMTAGLTESVEPVLFVECDPSGGDVAAWMDASDRTGIGSLASTRDADRTLDGVGAHVQRLESGLPVLVAPTRVGQASVAVREVAPWLMPLLSQSGLRAVVDAGRVNPMVLPDAVSGADLVVVVLRQSAGSAAATTARIDRTAELVEALTRVVVPHVLVGVGKYPYGWAEIMAHIETDMVGALPEEPQGAAAAAGGWTVGRGAGRSLLAATTRKMAAAVFDRVGVSVP